MFSLAGKTRCAFDCNTPNGECATKGEDRRKGQKAQLRAMRITLRAAKRTSTMICRRSFCKQIGRSPIRVTLIEIGLREKGKDLAGMGLFPAFFLCLKLP